MREPPCIAQRGGPGEIAQGRRLRGGSGLIRVFGVLVQIMRKQQDIDAQRRQVEEAQEVYERLLTQK